MNERTDTMSAGLSRCTFIANASALSAAALLGVSRLAAAEPPPEVKKIRLVHAPAICLSPQYLAEELLRMEGFSEIEYVDQAIAKTLGLVEAGRADMTMGAAPDVVAALDSGRGVVPLAGIHAGCYELFVTGRIAAIKDLKGRSVVITTEDSTERLFISSIVAYVGMNPRDIGCKSPHKHLRVKQLSEGWRLDELVSLLPPLIPLSVRHPLGRFGS
jgi:NitT/TauT family transport system substrate-binding protein